MEIKLDDKLIKSVVSEAILSAMDAQQRELLLKNAIQYLLTKQDGYGGRQQPSPIESAFNTAVENAARILVAEMLGGDDGFKNTIRGLIVSAVDKLETDNRDERVRRIADAIQRGIANDGR